MSEQKVFKQFCKDVQKGSSIDARSTLGALFDLISYEEFLSKFSNYNYIELIQVFNAQKKVSLPSYDDLIFGFLHLVVNNEDTAYQHLTNAIHNKPNHYLTYYLRSFINIEINNNCIDDAKEAIIINPNERTFLSLGNRYFENWKNSRAILSFQNSLKFNSDYVFARLQLARVFNSISKYDKAYIELKKCIKYNPEESIYYLEIGRSLAQMDWRSRSNVFKKKEKAFKYLNKGLSMDEENSLFHLELGKLYNEEDNLEESIYHFDKYLNLSGIEIEDEKISLKENSESKPIKMMGRSEDLREPEKISVRLSRLKKKKLIRDANTLLEKKKIAKALNIYEDLIKSFLNFNVHIDYEDLLVHAKYFKCKILSKNKDFKFDYNHPKYKWLDDDRDASEYRRSIYGIPAGAKIMEIVDSSEEIVDPYEDRETQFSFGKYKDLDLETVVEKDLSYINWCYFNIPSFFIVDLIRIDERLRRLKDYYKLLEIHLIKADYLFQIFDEEEEDYHTEHLSLGDVLGRGEAGIAYWNTH